MRRPAGCAIGLLAVLLIRPLAAAEAPRLEGEWRLVAATPAPWAREPALPDRAVLGTRVHIGGGRVEGGNWLRCGAARIEPTRFPADALFQGNLPAPAATAAAGLGIATLPVAGASLSCDSGLYEFHFPDADTALLALDNVIWTLSRAPGALAAPGSPEAAVEALLEVHFGGDMAFTDGGLAAKLPWLGRDLAARAQDWLARPQSPDEVPSINGDPFTDSQEYPARFAVGGARIDRESATVAVRFAGGGGERTLSYLLRREDAAWRLVDIVYPGGDRFLDLLE